MDRRAVPVRREGEEAEGAVVEGQREDVAVGRGRRRHHAVGEAQAVPSDLDLKGTDGRMDENVALCLSLFLGVLSATAASLNKLNSLPCLLSLPFLLTRRLSFLLPHEPSITFLPQPQRTKRSALPHYRGGYLEVRRTEQCKAALYKSIGKPIYEAYWQLTPY